MLGTGPASARHDELRHSLLEGGGEVGGGFFGLRLRRTMRYPLSKEKEKGFLPALWDSLSSVRLTIPLLIILAVASIFGTLIPQNGSPEEYLRIYKFSTFRVLRILGFLDLYHAGWFVFLLAVLSLNLMVCSLRRWPSVRKFFGPADIKPEEGQWKTVPPGRRFSFRGAGQDSISRVQQELSRLFAGPRVLEAGASRHLFAEKGKFSRLGFYFIHVSILVILLGGLIGSFYGFRGYINVVEGESADRVSLRSGQPAQPLGFRVRLDQFTVSFYPTGAPQEFKSKVTILEGDREVLTEPILVNHPLTYKGISFYQSSYGVDSVEKAVLEGVERASRRGFTLSLQPGMKAEIPGTHYALLLNRFLPDLQGMGPAFQAILYEDGRPAENLVILQGSSDVVPQRPGRFQFRIRELQPKYYSGLQVTRDPGVWVVWLGCILMMAGFYMAFFMSHRRVWVRLTEKQGDTLVEIAGSSHRNRIEFEKELERIGQTLKARLSPGQKKSSKGDPS
jgi:cytochrome c biogenesis protein